MSGNNDEKIVFHYSRERRLENASEAVKKLNTAGPTKRPSFFQTLTANRSLAFLFLAIIMLSLTTFVTNFLIPSQNTADIKGNRLVVSAFRFENAVYVALKKTTKNKNQYIGPVRMYVRPVGTDTFNFSADMLFSPSGSEEFKFKTVSTTTERIEVLLEVEETKFLLVAKIQ